MKQMVGRFMPTIAIIGLTIAFVYWLEWSGLFLILTGGGIAIGYLAQALGLNLQGLVNTPRTPWHLELSQDTLEITVRTRRLTIPLNAVQQFTLICDDNWDQIKGIEDKCLMLKLGRYLTLIVPGSSLNFDAVLNELRIAHEVPARFVE